MPRGYARTPQGEIHYAEEGAGEALLFLHAVPRSQRYFRHALPLFAPHFRAIAMDIPGFGGSEPLRGAPTMQALAAAVVRFLDAMQLERAHLFGLHTGNKIAAALAAEFPQRLGDLVLAGQTHSLIPDKAGRDKAILHLSEHYFPKYGESADGAHRVRQWAAAHAELQTLWWPQAIRTAAAVSAADLENAEAMSLDYVQGWRNILPVYQANFSFDLEDCLKRIRARTLVLELLTPEEMHLGEQAGRVCALVPGATAASLQGDGEVMETDPARVAEPALRFLRGNKK
jgi:pimeloyl-ACP methyl ester carboxylesterase